MKEGGVEKSFGIHVAKMAGMPKAVLECAEKTLAKLEKQREEEKKSKVKNTREGKIEKDGSLQLSFFQLDDPTLESLRDKLKNADLNSLSPLQAFDLLRSMKEELGL